MYSIGDDKSLNEDLTSYLKYFKTNFHSQLCLIQCVCGDQLNIQQKIAKAKSGIEGLDEQSISNQRLLSKLNIKTLERFCLRINQYIQFRIGKSRGLLQQNIINQLQAMCIALNRIFTQINKEKFLELEQSLQDIFIKISEVQNKYMTKIYKRVGQILNKSRLSDQMSKSINELILRKMKKNFIYQNYKIDGELTHTTQSSINNKNSKMSESPKKLTHQQQIYASRIRPRKSINQKNYRNPSAFIYHQLAVDQNNILCSSPAKSTSHLISRSPLQIGDDKNQIQHIVKVQMKANKSAPFIIYRKLQDVIEIGNLQQYNYTQEDLMNELMENNKKNIAMIQKFTKKMRKMKNKMENSPTKLQSKTVDIENQVRYKRSFTIQQVYNTKKMLKKQQKTVTLPLLKRKSIKL